VAAETEIAEEETQIQPEETVEESTGETKEEELKEEEPKEESRKGIAWRSHWNFGRIHPEKWRISRRGNIYAAASGIVNINKKERSISVTPVTNTPPHLQVGDIVIGQVTDVKGFSRPC